MKISRNTYDGEESGLCAGGIAEGRAAGEVEGGEIEMYDDVL